MPIDTKDEDDLVLDPFAGSCVTGEVCERLARRWLCSDNVETYLQGAMARFQRPPDDPQPKGRNGDDGYYKIPRPGLLWNGQPEEDLPSDGGRKRPPSSPRK